jgi:hypothetical protein
MMASLTLEDLLILHISLTDVVLFFLLLLLNSVRIASRFERKRDKS